MSNDNIPKTDLEVLRHIFKHLTTALAELEPENLTRKDTLGRLRYLTANLKSYLLGGPHQPGLW